MCGVSECDRGTLIMRPWRTGAVALWEGGVTLFTYVSNNILLMIDITFSVFLVPGEHFRIFQCPVALWLLTSESTSLHNTKAGLRTSDGR